jgi:threonine synthase
LKCGREHEPRKNLYVCEKCEGKLEIVYDYEKISKVITRKELGKRANGVWKYFELLPVGDRKNIVSLGEGGTPLLKAKNLGEELGLKHLYLKDETRNPTGSFKDRAMTVGVSKAREFGAKAVVTASSGNAAVALAAYAAKAGIGCYAFVPARVPKSKLAQILIHGTEVVRVRGRAKGDPTYERMLASWRRFSWHPIPSAGTFNPYHWEGTKTMSYEICEQLRWEAPDWVIVPTGAGTLLSGNAKGYHEFKQLGLIERIPKICAVQAKGCAPLVKAFEKDTPFEKIETWPAPKTLAGGLVDPFPWDADTALPAIRRSGGTAIAVNDGEILKAEVSLAKYEGVFAEPSGAASLAGLRQLLEEGTIDLSDVVVVEITGGGLKDPETALKLFEKPQVVEPKLNRLEKFLY